MKPPAPSLSAALEHLEHELSAAIAIPDRSASAASAAPVTAPAATPPGERPGRRPAAHRLSWLSLGILAAVAASQIDWARAGNPGPDTPPPARVSATPPRSTVAQAGAPVQRPSPVQPAAPPSRGESSLAPAAQSGESPGVAMPRLRIVSQRPAGIAPQRQAAQQALDRGDWGAAALHWRTLLEHDPQQVEAWLGLASLAEHQGQAAEAEHYRERARRADPGDPEVLAAWLSRPATSADPATESRLRGLLRQHPESAALHFALGNLLARQARWSEAQQSYFHAVAAEGGNPDYLFNLAVSLEHLHQLPAAARYYRLAVNAAAARAAAFSAAQAEQRLSILERPAVP